MDSQSDSQAPLPRRSSDSTLREILGYLNFSNGTPDEAFQRNFNAWHASVGVERPLGDVRDLLLKELEKLRGDSLAFADSHQAAAVIRIAFDICPREYRSHHSNLLFHLNDEESCHPFFLARMAEAVLAQGPPWTEDDRIVHGALRQLNDFVGFRPLAALENGQKMEPYAHERFRPVPLYLRKAGVAAGRYSRLIEGTIEFFRNTPEDTLREAHFDFALMDELALDVRAHDHLHPVNRRTNYMFGEWDPHLIDNNGRFRRFVTRKIILDALLALLADEGDTDPEERLYDASAVLCGTMLMASSISGSGPDTHDSNVTLTSLLPKVARQRDAFYARLLEDATGARAERLHREAELTQQPFGHVRQRLNIELAAYGAQQVQHRQLALLFARMGHSDACRQQSGLIPSVSARFECEIACRLTAAHQHLERSEVAAALSDIRELEGLLEDGIDCGGLIDPWNIVGFSGQFPLFSSREDSVPDQRAEVLLLLMDRLFAVYSRGLSEAAATGDETLANVFSTGFRKLADNWDRYATLIVEDLPEVSGQENWESAKEVSHALARWKEAGQSAGDISFWQQHVDRFESAKAYALVVDTLLRKKDQVAAMGLLMRWLSEANVVGLESDPYSMHNLLIRWMDLVTTSEETADDRQKLWSTLRRLFDHLEANAGELWHVPILDVDGYLEDGSFDEDWPEDLDDQMADEELESDEDNLFEAAYDNVIYRDSAADGFSEEILDSGSPLRNTEFDVLTRELEPRLKFINTLAQLWQLAAATLVSSDSALDSAGQTAPGKSDCPQETVDGLLLWHSHAHDLQRELSRLANAVWNFDIPFPSGELDANIEFDLELQTKYYLLHTIIGTQINCRTAQRLLLCCTSENTAVPEQAVAEKLLVDVYRAVLNRDKTLLRRLLPKLTEQLSKNPLLYIPFDNGGHPRQVQSARALQAVVRFLLEQLPQMGMLRETWQLLNTAYRMERASRPEGLAVTEFDRVFQTALRSSLRCVIQSSETWRSEKFPEPELVGIVDSVVEHYQELWLKHSSTMRLSAIEELKDEQNWQQVHDFISKYGGELFHARLLTLGNVRAVLYTGIDSLLDHLRENRDPLQPSRLLDDLENGQLDSEEVIRLLEFIYGSVVDRFDRFMEYNTTTTQSDYGEKFYLLLEFLRLEARYERDAWEMLPLGIAHEMLSTHGKNEAATIWEQSFQEETRETADQHLTDLDQLEDTYGMQLPSMRDRLNERFVKPLAGNRMMALVPLAMAEAREPSQGSESFHALRAEIDKYLQSTFGSGIDIPPWLRQLDDKVEQVDANLEDSSERFELDLKLPTVTISLREMNRQLSNWDASSTEDRDSENAN